MKKGDPLAVIDSPDIGLAVSDVHKAEADPIAAEHDFKRQKELFEEKAGSAADQEAAEDNWRKAKAELERARQKAHLLRAGNVDGVTQAYALRSPIDGEVLTMTSTPGIEVQGQYTRRHRLELFTIGEIDKVWVLADVFEMDLARVKVGANAVVKVVAYKDKVFDGTVDWVADCSTRARAPPRCAARSTTPIACSSPRCSPPCRSRWSRRRRWRSRATRCFASASTRSSSSRSARADGGHQVRAAPVDVDEGESSEWLEVQHGLDAGQNVVVSGAILLSQKL